MDKSFSRDKAAPSAEKEFPITAILDVRLIFSVEDMEKVRKWYDTTRTELGDKFLAEFKVDRLIYEALTGGAVNPSVISTRILDEVDRA